MPHKDPERRREYNRQYMRERRRRKPEEQRNFNRKWREKYPDKVKKIEEARKRRDPNWARRAHPWRRFGLTLEEFQEMWEAQKGLCAVCGVGPAQQVDHCHQTDEVRSLLCGPCNRALGLMGEEPSRLRRAAEYIERHLKTQEYGR